MNKSLLALALAAPLALSACDDGAEEIAALNTRLEAERARIVELETQANRVTELEGQVARLPELEEQVASVETLTAERDQLRTDFETANTELETMRARVAELEAAPAAAPVATADAPAFDAAQFQEPLSVSFVKLRDADRELRTLRRQFNDNPEVLQALGSVRSRLSEAGREIGRVAESAKIDLSQSVGD